MPDTATTAWQGHGAMAGVDTRTDPSELGNKFASSAVNRTFRGSQNATRPPIQSKRTVFVDTGAEDAFTYGNVQGGISYAKTMVGTQQHIILASGDRIIKGRMYADTIEFSTLAVLETPGYLHGWFVQGEDRLYYQNGVDIPIGWSGRGDPYKIHGGIAADRMPIGTNMAYIHGRVVVFTANNHAIVSDYVYGAGLNTTKGLENFIETQQYNDIGAIPTPAMLGAITGAIPVPRTPDRDAQGELLVMCENGAFTLALNGVRADWLLGDVSQIVMTGIGGASVSSLVAANNDIWFRTSDGDISTYKFQRTQQDRTWGDVSMSREVAEYLDYDSGRNLEFCSSIKANNRLLTTCAHAVAPHDEPGYGSHHFGRGIVVLDFDKGSTVNQKPGFAWDGLWTGINPVLLLNHTVDRQIRNLAVSHDEDGKNRIYEFMPDNYRGSDMVDGRSKKIVSFYQTAHLLDQKQEEGSVIQKRLTGGRAEVSEVRGEASVEVKFAPNYYPCFQEWSGNMTVGSDGLSQQRPIDQKEYYDILRWGEPDREACEHGSYRLTSQAAFFTAQVEMRGDITVNQLQISTDVQNEDTGPTCNSQERTDRFNDLVNCGLYDLFDYSISRAVEAG